MGADGDIAGQEHSPGPLLGKLNVPLHIAPERGTDIHQLATGTGFDLFAIAFQLANHRIPQPAPVLPCGMV